MLRPVCKICGKNPRAAAYYRAGKRYFRSRCTTCIARGRQQKPPQPRWKQRGYNKKTACDLCGFTASYSTQIAVLHIDGDLNNCDFTNLRSVCLCCIEIVKRKYFTWKVGEIEPDH